MTTIIPTGVPAWTEGGFTRSSAQGDLGTEDVAQGLMRRLVPGLVATTPNAGYMGPGGIEAEYAGVRNGGGYWGRRVAANAHSKKVRRASDRLFSDEGRVGQALADERPGAAHRSPRHRSV